jgi:hypothetical protein
MQFYAIFSSPAGSPSNGDMSLAMGPEPSGCASPATSTGLPLDPRGHREGARFLLVLADWLQDQFFPETRSAWGEARPACPGHPHPARAVNVADEAWWTCPLDGRRIARIGRVATFRGDGRTPLV